MNCLLKSIKFYLPKNSQYLIVYHGFINLILSKNKSKSKCMRKDQMT